MGKSNPDPAFFKDEGARFTTTFSVGMVKPQARSAAFTRSRDSCTAASAIPTTVTPGRPDDTTTSTSTG